MRPVILFAHGAGAGHDHPWMQRWFLRLQDIGDVVPLTYRYRQEGRRMPDSMADLESTHLALAASLAAKHSGRPLVLAGKSMGGRVSVRVANQTEAVAVVAFGYPLVSSGRKKTRRDAALRAVRVPTLLIQGTRDAMGPIDELTDLVADHPTSSLRMRIVDDGDHSLECRKRPLRLKGLGQDDIDTEIQFDVKRFLDDIIAARVG